MQTSMKLLLTAPPDQCRAALRFHIVEEFQRTCHFYFYAAFQIFLTFCRFDKISCRTAATISISERKQESIQILHLHTILPDFIYFTRMCPIGITGR